jgi:hypothetical protein
MSEPTSAERCGPKLQLTRQRVNTHHASYLDLELIYRVPDLQSGDNQNKGVIAKWSYYILILVTVEHRNSNE